MSEALKQAAAYDLIDRFLRNNLYDDDYAKYSDALEAISQPAPSPQPATGEPSWWMREADEGAEWTDTAPLVLSGWTPLYTTPQPTQATQTELTDEQILEIAEPFGEFQYGDAQGHKRIDFARAILALHPQASPDGRGTDAQILKEREIARHAIDGAIAAGYAGATHPGADHWLAAAHNAGMRIAELERAMTPVPCNTALQREIAAHNEAVEARKAEKKARKVKKETP